ncbi:unnamed protein product [Tuber aestivum]|uniref:Uncharacterized protein n=1 Tax=Tuber aestivum TaxID=59557 RepID=A0A292PSK5_9PEZI|nr:unnamed protein product [Tuber aestivum]
MTTTATTELAFPLPHTHSTTVHVHLTLSKNHILLHLTTKTPETASQPAALGSFVYALPPTGNHKSSLSTAIYVRESTLETATRIAKILAKRTGLPAYVGNSMSFASAGMGGGGMEEVEGVKRVVEVVCGEVEVWRRGAGQGGEDVAVDGERGGR